MGWAGGIVVYTVTWWLVFFMVLPWGVQKSEDPVPGQELGAPERPRIFTKMAVTTGITTVLFVIIWVIQAYDLIEIRDRVFQ